MKIVKLTETNYQELLSLAEGVLKKGGVIIGPSDTVYGLYADATNEEAVKKIFKIKKRAPAKALPVFVKDTPTARKLAYIDDRKARFLEKIWPGLVTVVFFHKRKLPAILTGGHNTIGMRIPDHPLVKALLERIDFPLAETSANTAGKMPIRSIAEVPEELFGDKKIDLMIDGGELAGRASTVIDFTKQEPILLRVGPLSKRELDEAFRQ